jgi:hypothetical protein
MLNSVLFRGKSSLKQKAKIRLPGLDIFTEPTQSIFISKGIISSHVKQTMLRKGTVGASLNYCTEAEFMNVQSYMYSVFEVSGHNLESSQT